MFDMLTVGTGHHYDGESAGSMGAMSAREGHTHWLDGAATLWEGLGRLIEEGMRRRID